jgi:hypothetical protein
MAEDEDFSSVFRPAAESKGLAAPGGSSEAGATACPYPALEHAGRHASRDQNVIFVFSSVCCRLELLNKSRLFFSQKKYLKMCYTRPCY